MKIFTTHTIPIPQPYHLSSVDHPLWGEQIKKAFLRYISYYFLLILTPMHIRTLCRMKLVALFSARGID